MSAQLKITAGGVTRRIPVERAMSKVRSTSMRRSPWTTLTAATAMRMPQTWAM